MNVNRREDNGYFWKRVGTWWISEWLLNVLSVYVGSKYRGTLTRELCVCWLQYIVYIKLFCNVKEAPWFKRGFMAALFSSTQFFQKINHTYIHPPKRKVCLLYAVLFLQASESSFMLGKLSSFGDPFGGYGNRLWLRWLLFCSGLVWFLRAPMLASGRPEF